MTNAPSLHKIKHTYWHHFLRILLGISLGIVVGLYFPQLSSTLSNCQGVFTNLLKMCFIPLIICSITVELARFIRSYDKISLKRYFILVGGSLILVSVLSILSILILRPGERVNISHHSTFEDVIQKNSVAIKNIDTPVENPSESSFLDFIRKSVTDNIFSSLASNQILQIMVFSVIFAIGAAYTRGSDRVLDYFETTYDVFSNIFDYILMFLPVFVFFSTSLSVVKIGYEIMLGLLPFLKALFLVIGCLFFMNWYILCRVYKTSSLKMLKEMSIPSLVAFSSSPVATLVPVRGFFRKFGVTGNRSVVGSIVPLSLFINRFGPIIYFTCASLFIGQLYHHTFRLEELVFIFIFSILYGIATAGIIEGLSITFLGVLLDPLGIPIGPTLIILTSIDFIITPFLSMTTVQTNMSLIALGMQGKASYSQDPSSRALIRDGNVRG